MATNSDNTQGAAASRNRGQATSGAPRCDPILTNRAQYKRSACAEPKGAPADAATMLSAGGPTSVATVGPDIQTAAAVSDFFGYREEACPGRRTTHSARPINATPPIWPRLSARPYTAQSTRIAAAG